MASTFDLNSLRIYKADIEVETSCTERVFTDLVSDCAFCCKKVSLCRRMFCKLFLSISLAAGGTLLMRKASGNQMMLAVRVTAGTCTKDL